MHDILFDFISQYISLNESEKQAMRELNLFHFFKKKSILLEEGQYSQHAYLVMKGCIRSYYVIDGEERTTAFYTEMEGIEPSSVITKSPSPSYLSCIEDSIIAISQPEMEKEIFEKFPKFETMCRVLSEQSLAKQQISFDAFKTSSPEQRYLNLLEKRPDLLKRVPQHQIASYLGIKPQSLSRMRARIMKKKA